MLVRSRNKQLYFDCDRIEIEIQWWRSELVSAPVNCIYSSGWFFDVAFRLIDHFVLSSRLLIGSGHRRKS